MLQRLESRKWAMGNSLLHLKMTKEELQRHEEQLPSAVRSLLLASKQCSLASRQLDEAEKLLAGERGYGHLQHLQKLLRIRQQYMVTQVSSIYPVKCLVGKTSEEKINSDHRGNTSEEDSVSSSSHVSKPNNNNNNNTEAASSLTILGLPLPTPTLRKPSFFSDKKEAQRSATSLGYVAHAVSLIASYLDVPLRYPVHLGGSRSYIHDNAPSVDPVSSDLSLSSSEVVVSPKPVEFPLFLEGQDTTRAAYAIFLLNKIMPKCLDCLGSLSLSIAGHLPQFCKLSLIPQIFLILLEKSKQSKNYAATNMLGTLYFCFFPLSTLFHCFYTLLLRLFVRHVVVISVSFPFLNCV
ncbi:uncharacterized protein LOC18426253 isoform X4 [Amborella trichopoda]|nr:uncharacterized protein LOC18426253 isoform X4 [Amborella trichopoda]|eukprot:XP_020517976.1 uncharacterized protein LOC18426253 isoform X4 [Amborella trichopoda]